MPASIRAGARASPLSRAQVKEVEEALSLKFSVTWTETVGDKDKATSLKTLDKTDFFTRELDELLLSGEIDVCIHSAKDLPHPLPSGLEIVAITKGKNPKDALVIKEGKKLFPKAVIATSSKKREEAVLKLEPDVTFIDLRGTIHERLDLLKKGVADGVVIAEAALLRLGLDHLPRLYLPGETTPHQGQLALVARKNDYTLKQLGKKIDVRKKVLFLGLECPDDTLENVYTHEPLIECQKINAPCPNYDACSHLLFTSKTSVKYFFNSKMPLSKKFKILAIGEKTAKVLSDAGHRPHFVAKRNSSIGVLEMIDTLKEKPKALFWPHSCQSLPIISQGLKRRKIPLVEWLLYETKTILPKNLIPLKPFDVIEFTSPSCVDSFLAAYGSLPKDKVLKTIGETTQKSLDQKMSF